MIKLSDYVAQKLAENGIGHVFMLTGGGAMHLDDSLGKNRKLKCIFNHHEQACAIAAESYARLTGKMAAVCVTTGPGGTNAITGVYGAWTDSIPMVIISGQVRYDTTVASTGLPLRQLGDQEVDIVRMVGGITKYAVTVSDPGTIRYHLEKALHLAKTKRPGPCWIDIPINVQASLIDPSKLKAYDPKEDGTVPRVSESAIKQIISRIKTAERPVMLIGSAVRLAGANAELIKLAERLNIPLVTAWNAHDSVPDSHSLYFGRPGSVGDRAGNFIVQNSDLLLVLGCRLNIRQLSYDWKTFARRAYKIIVDIDALELKKPTIKPDLPLNADVKEVIVALIKELKGKRIEAKKGWLQWCRERKERYPVVLPEYWKRKRLVNPYCFMQALSREIPAGQVTVTGDGTACVCAFQAMEIKKGQRLYTNSGCAAMGYDLPAAIGACFGAGKKKIVCLAGDGSIQLNLQELQTIVHHRLPIKIFVLNNNGYLSIKQTQKNFFGLPYVGCGPESGLSFPSSRRIADAYRIHYLKIDHHAEMKAKIRAALKRKGPVICEVLLATDQPFAPKSASKKLPDGRMISRPLEDMAPFLSRQEFMENMLIDPVLEQTQGGKR